MAKILSNVLYGIIWVFSLLPLNVLYLFSDIVWLLMYLFPPLRYRKKIVRKNLSMASVRYLLRQTVNHPAG